MKLYRFVGENEVFQLLTNKTIKNNRDWSQFCDTNSKGICFFAYNRTNKIDHIVNTVLDDWCFDGIVKTFALVEIEVPTARKAWGFYAGGKRSEYNLTEYSLKDIKAIYRINREIWEDKNNIYGYKTKKVF